MIEIGRYNQTTKDNRYCPFCGSSVIEDEVHFLFYVLHTLLLGISKFYYNSQESDSKYYPVVCLINELMNSSNYFINIHDKLLSK